MRGWQSEHVPSLCPEWSWWANDSKTSSVALPAFQWNITAKDPAVLQLDGLGCGLQLGGQSSRRGRTLVPPIGQGVSIERSDRWVMLGRVLLMGRRQRLQGRLPLVVCRLLCGKRETKKDPLYFSVCTYVRTHARGRFPPELLGIT